MIPEGTVVKAGDELILYGADLRNTKSIVTVDRVTPTGRIVVGGEQYKSNGVSVRTFDRWGTRASLSLPTEKARKEVEDENNLRICESTNWRVIDAEKRARIVAILNEKEGN